MNNIVEFKNVFKTYKLGDNEVHAINDLSFTIKEKELCIILGPSGAGKTTILNLLGGMDQSSKGDIIINDNNISKYNEKQLTLYRRNEIGFVFQFYNLISNLTALENIEIATELKKDSLNPLKIIDLVGLKERKDNFPSQLSGGEQQRISIARAIAKNPQILLCDEPTGALDYQTGKKVLKVIHDITKKQNKTTIIVTHNQALKEMADHVIYIKNGKVEKEEFNDNPKDIELIEW